MSDALLVLNAGSSSLKFSVFLNDDPLRLLLHGQLEGLLTQPRFIARNATAVVGEKEWPSGTQLGHQGAIEFLFTWGRERCSGRAPHRCRWSSRRAWRRKVHRAGARRRIDLGRAGSAGPAGAFAPAAQCGRDQSGGEDGAGAAAGCVLRHRVSPDAAKRLLRLSLCRAATLKKGCAATAFTVCPTNTSRRCCRRWIARRPMAVQWLRTWAMAPVCAR